MAYNILNLILNSILNPWLPVSLLIEGAALAAIIVFWIFKE
jgi:Na+-driven multidrug efflux pump